MEQVIINEFLSEYHHAKDLNGLMKEFETYKKLWNERMVEYLIQELEIDEEDAKVARKDPESFHINYETYKLFINSF